MTLQTLRQWLLCGLTFCLHSTTIQANPHTEVEAFTEVSALPILMFDVENDANEAAPHDTLRTAALPLQVGVDSVGQPADTAKISQMADSLSTKTKKTDFARKQFRPDPQRALWLSLVLPGAGQIYNRKYWKLPFVYGGFLGCAYALMWNQQMYKDYSQAYLDIMDDDPNTNSFLEMLPPRYDITGREEQFKRVFKRKKDFYRRYRDLSAFCFVGVYLLSVVDAYVDAQLSEFDITPTFP